MDYKESAAGRLDVLEENLLAALSNPGRPKKEDSEVTDPKSTGRKRAAVEFPIDPNAFCEWRGLANCGGGRNPIIGCISGKQRHRHHGPDKNTLRNETGNVHRICHYCHNRWHAANDNDYDPTINHEPRPATAAEYAIRLAEEESIK